jgi:hypothetical protein
MIIKTPKRNQTNRRVSKFGLNRSGIDAITSSESKRSQSKSQVPHLIEQNPENTLVNYYSKKTVSSKERTHSTKASKNMRGENLQSFEGQYEVASRKRNSNTYGKARKRNAYENFGFSKDTIEEMMN